MPSDKPTHVVSWDDVDEFCETLAKSLDYEKQFWPIQTIVGISRGGAIPAIILSHMLDVRKVRFFYAKAYEDRVLGKQHIQKGFTEDLNFTTTLLVDDILDSGITLKYVGRELPAARKAVLIGKYADTSVRRAFNVKPNVWVKFPWEQN